jgi:hypothetical protein
MTKLEELEAACYANDATAAEVYGSAANAADL